MATRPPGFPPSSGRCLFVTDRRTGVRFLFDTGAEVSVLPTSRQDRTEHHSPSSPSLTAVNGSSTKTYGQRCINIDLGLRRYFSWLFLIADVSHTILGADFLSQFSLQVDLRRCRLVDTVTSLSVNAFFSTAPAEFIYVTIAAFSDPFDLLSKYPTLIRPPDYHRPVHHPVVHRIETSGQPVHSRARRLPQDRLQIAKDEFHHMLNLGIVKLSTSNWSSPLHMIPQPNGDWRPCGDYRGLNAHTTADRYPNPISRISGPHSTVHGFFPKSTWCVLTTSYRSTPTISRRLQSPPRSASSSILECRSACETLPNHFNVLWTVFFMTFRSCSCTSKTSSSPAKMKPNIAIIWRPYSSDLQKTASPSMLPSVCSQLTHWISSATTFPLPESDRWQRRSPTSESSRS